MGALRWVYLSSLQGLDVKLGAKVKLAGFTHFGHPPVPQTLETPSPQEREEGTANIDPPCSNFSGELAGASAAGCWLLALFW